MSKGSVMPLRVAYWTSAPLEPAIEAVSKEVFGLAEHFPGAKIVGLSPHLSFRLGWRPTLIGLSTRIAVLLRLLAPLIEKVVDLNHLYAEVAPWHFFRSLGAKPIVLTIASEKGEVNPDFIDRASAVVVQTESMYGRLARRQDWRDKLHLIYPGVEVSRLQLGGLNPAPLPRERLRVLFATFPRSHEELNDRGVSLLIEIARETPEVDFALLTRPWAGGDTATAPVRETLGALKLPNVTLLEGQQEMAVLYRQHHFTIIPYTTADGGKECPLSMVEGMACGLPVLISRVAPFAPFVSRHHCGAVFDPSPAGFRKTLATLRSHYEPMRAGALNCAQGFFDVDATYSAYEKIYQHCVSKPVTQHAT